MLGRTMEKRPGSGKRERKRRKDRFQKYEKEKLKSDRVQKNDKEK
jgi:hypothetical protein